jgi:hypothetical protein
VIMGGFAIFEGDDVHHVVVAEELDDLLKNGDISITEKEIRDKGRGDALSKGLILIQTTWFILQCVARKVAHLPITELELVTLAFATLNFATYAAWWYKPLNVECPVRVYRQGKEQKKDNPVSSGTCGDRDAEAGESNEAEGAGRQEEAGESTEASGSAWVRVATDIKTTTTTTVQAVTVIVSETPASIGKAMAEIGRALRNHVRKYRWHVVWHALAAVLFPVSGLLFGLGYVLIISRRLGWSADDDDVIGDGAKEVPTFYPGPELIGHETRVAGFAACIIAMIFGSVHLVGWSFAFLSNAEQYLWCIASISITTAPVSIIVMMILTIMSAPFLIQMTWVLISAVASFLYLISRLMLLILPFMSLRSLPAEAYQAVQWTTFIPHV